MNKKVLVGVIALLVILGGVLLFYFGSGDLLKGSIRRGGFERGAPVMNKNEVIDRSGSVESRGIIDPNLNADEFKDNKAVNLDKAGTVSKGGGSGGGCVSNCW